MPRARRPDHTLSAHTLRQREYLRTVKLSPRVKMAARLYATGGAPTKKAACETVGLHPNILTMYMAHNQELNALIGEVDEAILAKSIDLGAVIKHLEVKALAKMNTLMQSNTEGIAFKAAQDLLDRGPNTGKVQKVQGVQLTLDGTDAKELAKALLASRQVMAQFAEVTTVDYEQVTPNVLPDVTE